MASPFMGDVGTIILLNTGEDLSTATSTKIRMRKPSGSVIELTAVVYNTTYLKYITVAATFYQIRRAHV